MTKRKEKKTSRRPSAPRVPKRPDPRRDPNVNSAEHHASSPKARARTRRPPPPRAGEEVENIATRRLRAMELRKTGATYREIARQLGVTVATAYGDVVAELLELRGQTAHEASDVRDIELQRCDAMIEGLWSGVQCGNPKAVMAAVRVSERRARLLGIDAPQAMNWKGELAVNRDRDMPRIEKEIDDQELAEYLDHQRAANAIIERVRARLRAADNRHEGGR